MLWATQFADDVHDCIYYDEFINFSVDEKYHKYNNVALIMVLTMVLIMIIVLKMI